MALTERVTTFNLELSPGGAPPVLSASQGDIGRTFTASTFWNGTAYTVGSYTCKLRGKKPDNTVFEYTATTSSSTVTFATTEQMTIVPGPVECELVFFDTSSNQIASANFLLIVEEATYDPDALSESDVTTLGDILPAAIGEWIDTDGATDATFAGIVADAVTDYLDENDLPYGDIVQYEVDLTGTWNAATTMSDSTGVVGQNSWCISNALPLDNIDLIKLNDTTGGHLWYAIHAYDGNLNYVGVWDNTNNTFVQSEKQIRVSEFLVSKIKQQYPYYHFFIKMVKDNGGMSVSYGSCLKAYKLTENNDVSNLAGNVIDWAAGAIGLYGELGEHNNAISTTEFIPDDVSFVVSSTNMRLVVYETDGTYAGLYCLAHVRNPDNQSTVTATIYSKQYDLAAVRSLRPGAKFKLTVYDVNKDITRAGDVVFARDNETYSKECMYEVPLSYEETLIYSQANVTNHTWQGFGTDGTYLYIAEPTDRNNEETAETIIRKIDPADGSVVLTSSGLVLGHANHIGYDPVTGYLLIPYTIPSNRYLLYRVKASDLTFVDTIDLSSLMQSLNLSDTNPSGIAYVSEVDGFVIYSAFAYMVTDRNFDKFRAIRIIKPDAQKGQSLIVDKNMLVQVCLYYSTSNSKNTITFYDWHGNQIYEQVLEWDSNGELEGLCKIGDTYYKAFHASTNRIYKCVPKAYTYISPEEVQKQFNLNY